MPGIISAVIAILIVVSFTAVVFAEYDGIPVVTAIAEEVSSTVGGIHRDKNPVNAAVKVSKKTVRIKAKAANGNVEVTEAEKKVKSDANVSEVKYEAALEAAMDAAFNPKQGDNR
jgi:hypothetical protein